MQRLKDLYQESQSLAKFDRDRLTLSRCKKMQTLANKQYQEMIALDDYASLDELAFYREKFVQAVELLADADERGVQAKTTLEKVAAVFKDDPPRGKREAAGDISPILNKKDEGRSETPQETFSHYFNSKKQQIQSSKLGFKTLLETSPRPLSTLVKQKQKPQQKFASSSQQDDYIVRLKDELNKLRSELQEKNSEREFNLGILEVEKCDYDQQIEDLERRIAAVERENTLLRERTAHSQTPSKILLPVSAPSVEPQGEREAPWSSPYHINYKRNDISKLKTEADRTFPGFLQKQAKAQNTPLRITFHEPKLPFPELLPFKPQFEAEQPIQRKDSFPMTASNLKLKGSQIEDRSKNIAVRSKISFFKQPMVLYRGSAFQLAVKAVDVVRLESKRVTIFLNNKQPTAKAPELTYKYNSRYYEVARRRKMGEVGGREQGREEVEVGLVGGSDLDSVIEVELAVGAKTLNFLLPTMFLEFTERRPPGKQGGECIRVNPIHQVSTMALAEEILPLERVHEGEEEGRVYAISKHHEGYIYFRWLHGVLEVNTIPPWRLFLAYLLLKDC